MSPANDGIIIDGQFFPGLCHNSTRLMVTTGATITLLLVEGAGVLASHLARPTENPRIHSQLHRVSPDAAECQLQFGGGQG